jgi:hypothetical protein
MATALDICKAALKRLNVIASTEEPSAADAADTLSQLNDLLGNYIARGCAELEPAMAGLGAEWTSGDQYLQAVKDVLTERIARTFGISPDADIASASGRGDRLIMRHFLTKATYGVDSALTPSRMSNTFAGWAPSE